MVEKIKEIKPPRGLARLAFRLPIWFYRLGLGGLLGTRFLLLTHTGRKSGRNRHTVLEVVRFDNQGPKFTVAAGFGPGSDWYRNIGANPYVTLQCGHHQWKMVALFLSPEQAGEALLDYAKRHPTAMRELARFMGYRTDGSQEDIRLLGRYISMVTFQPEGMKED
ncbi:MAG: nitroreductase family deazaflavin-dependent oxidoreductase [Anaerolineales bacterium]